MGKSNLVLIGMPGSGKSTLGQRLAKRLNYQFLDTDLLLEKETNLDLQDIVNLRGLPYFLALEERILCNLNCRNTVIATGGSAIYSQAAMNALGAHGIRIYLCISLASMLQRVSNQNNRGLVKLAGRPMQYLYQERKSLYPRFADIVVDNNRPVTQQSLDRVIEQIAAYDADYAQYR